MDKSSHPKGAKGDSGFSEACLMLLMLNWLYFLYPFPSPPLLASTTVLHDNIQGAVMRDFYAEERSNEASLVNAHEASATYI